MKTINRTFAEILRAGYPRLKPDFAAAQNVTIHPRVAGERAFRGRGAQHLLRFARSEGRASPIWRRCSEPQPANGGGNGVHGVPGKRPPGARTAARVEWKGRYGRPLEELWKLADHRENLD